MSSIFTSESLPSQESKIMITGGTGLVGSEILKQLVSLGYSKLFSTCRVSSNIPESTWSSKVQWLVCNILDVIDVYENIRDKDIVIHAAAEVSFTLSKRDLILQTSSIGTANVVNACLEHKVSKLIHISSVAAIGRQKIEEVIDESKVFAHSAFDTTYGLAKFLAEQEVWRGHAEGLNVAIINPSTIIGNGASQRSSMQLFDKIYKDQMPYYPQGSTGWVNVEDVALASINCMSANINGQRYIISAENIYYKDVFELIGHAIGKIYKGKPLKPLLAKFLIRIEWLLRFFMRNNPFINKETMMSTSTKSHYVNTKSIKELGINYKSIQETILNSGKAYTSFGERRI